MRRFASTGWCAINNRWHIAVLIPAKDEETLLPRCLASVQAARNLLPPHVSTDVILVSDASMDNTLEIARAMLQNSGLALDADFGTVGSARSLATKIAIERANVAPERIWLANTDADCEVPVDWLKKHLAVAQKGFAAVAGIVDVDSFAEHDAHVPEMFRKTYLIGKDGSHPHVHGANLGLRADVYLRVGGWMNLQTAEDHDLWNRVRKLGHHQLSDASLQVITSGRRVGRAPMGFANALAAHNGATS